MAISSTNLSSTKANPRISPNCSGAKASFFPLLSVFVSINSKFVLDFNVVHLELKLLKNRRKEMGAKVVGARGGREATEGKAANPIAKAARTRSAFTSLIPPKRKLVKKMMWDSMVQAIVFCFCSINKKKNNNNNNKSKSKIFLA
ncbi:hypothetical protein RHSIM_Rhsim11G0072700 [Rhododendron simsii]|uniref:Uncharacterized protein n=1 Tax=Rhododendron simsii TaxID=118357 RepID=A0A834LBE9_RHOSS|nr:hypothetical protein RHSIM_Rhsim11G0072700 [Rhododendron simsii]